MSWKDDAYARAPIPVQDALCTARGAYFRFRRSDDRGIRSRLATLLASERVPAEQRRDAASAALGTFLRDAAATTPYYRTLVGEGRLAAIWRETDPLAHLAEVPLLEKSRVRGHEVDFYDERFADGRTITGFTSGTTGSPMRTRETQISLSRRFAFVARLRTWAGLSESIHPRRVQFTGRAICQDHAPYWRRNLADHALLASTVHISLSSVAGYADAIRRFGPELIDGYPSAMLAVVKLAEAGGVELPHVPVVICSAETLTASMRETIERGLGARVYNQYAASEPSCFWSDCEHGTLHIHDEYGVSEILGPDGEPVGAGEIGEVVVTSLLNPAMPLIRYRTGDLARSGTGAPCPCGRTLPTVLEVLGRTDDILYVPERGFVGRLDPVYKGVEGIAESQIVQEQLDVVRVLVVVDERWDAAQEHLLQRNLRAKLGELVRIDVEQVDRIARGANGKFRTVVSRCREQYPVDLQPY